jgi:hypothetical protein
MQGPEYLFFLKDMDTGLYYRVENGAVLTGPPVPLQYSPSGWKALSISNKRNLTYFALDRSFTSAMDFVEDGGKIIKHVFYNYGFEKNIQFIVARQVLFIDATQYGYEYELFYQGEVDLSTFSHDGPKATVSIMEGGILKYIKAFQNAKYNIDIDVPEAVTIKMDGIKLSNDSNYSTIDDGQGLAPAIPSFPGLQYSVLWLTVQFISNSGANINADQRSTDILTESRSIGNYNDSGHPDNWFYQANDAITVRIKFTVTMKQLNGKSLELYIKNSNGTRTSLHTITNPSILGGVFQQTDVVNVDVTMNLAAGEKLYLLSQLYRNPLDNVGASGYYYETTITVSLASRYRSTYIKGLPPEYVFKKILEQMTSGAFTGMSSMLANNSNFVITCGDAIRGLAGAKIKTSLAEFFQSINCNVDDIGMGAVAGVLRLELKTFFVDYTDPIFLGEVSRMKPKVAGDYCFNTIKVGPQSQNYDAALGAVNGKLEFNNTFNYTTPVTRKTKDLDLSSPYRTDSLGIEFTRINLDGKTTTDNSSDNDVFIIHTEKVAITEPGQGAVYRLNRDLNPFATGVLDTSSVFNLYLSPGQCFKRNGRFIHSCFYQQEAQKLVFQTTDKNEDLTFTMPGGIVIKDAEDVEISRLLDPLFRPVSLEIEVPSPVDLFEILDRNPVKAFSWTFEGVLYMGIPVDASCEPYTADKQTYTMLSAPSNDLTPLIDVYE